MTLDDCWLDAAWTFVRTQLPPPPARVLEIGCGRRGGFVPALLAEGYDAIGVDPEAPELPGYQRIEFEKFEATDPFDAAVASTSLHHVADLGNVLDKIAHAALPGGALVVAEWAWERFDETTAQWCFARLDSPAPESEHNWLHSHRHGWATSGLSWDAYREGWAKTEGLHRGAEIVDALDARFERSLCVDGPYFFCDLASTTEHDEQAAIDTGEIQPTGIRYAASPLRN